MTFERAIRTANISEIRARAKTTSVPQIVSLLEKLKTPEVLVFFRLLDAHRAAEVFTELSPARQTTLIKLFTKEKTKEIFDEILTDEIADIIEELPAEMVSKILKITTPKKRKLINKILSYDEEDTGSFMSVDIIKLQDDLTAAQALSHIKTHKEHKEESQSYYVVNKNGNLLGVVNLDDLTFSEKNLTVKSLMEYTPFVRTTANREVAAQEFRHQDLPTLPVVNNQNILVGMITADDVLDVLTEEQTEDVQLAAGIQPVQTSYFKTSLARLILSRIFWLLLLMFSATVSQTVMQVFIRLTERALHLHATSGGAATGATLSTIIALLVSIIPDISGTSGNAGSQSTTTVARSIALGDVKTRDFRKVFCRESQIGVVAGGILSLANFVRLIIYYAIYASIYHQTLAHNHHMYVWISLGASLAMWVVVVLSKVTGGILPIIAVKMHIDPAVMSAPLLTTIIDALSIVVFFAINIGILFYAVPSFG